MTSSPAYDILAARLHAAGLAVDAIKTALKGQHIETPSWGYSNSGTRFKTFPWPGAAVTVPQKLEDAAFVNKVTGIAPSVAVHIPWDKTDDWAGMQAYAKSLGLAIGAVNPNVFQDVQYKLGSVANPSAEVRQRALDHLLECVEICKIVHSPGLSIWLVTLCSFSSVPLRVPRSSTTTSPFGDSSTWSILPLRRSPVRPGHGRVTGTSTSFGSAPSVRAQRK